MKPEALIRNIESEHRPHNEHQNTHRKPRIHTPHGSNLKKKVNNVLCLGHVDTVC